jgi:hypothetical protein
MARDIDADSGRPFIKINQVHAVNDPNREALHG